LLNIYTAAVVNQCALEHDLELFDVGDATEVGERGLTLRFVIHQIMLIGSEGVTAEDKKLV